VNFFTMGRCPFCALTLESLKPILHGSLGDHLHITKDRYILQALIEHPTSVNDFNSLHGPGEVVADAFELCAQLHYPDVKQWLPFIWCLDQQYYAVGTYNITDHCANQMGFNFTLLHECAWGPEGVRMLKGSADQAKKLKIFSAPSIFFNGRLRHQGMLLPGTWADLICSEISCQQATPRLYPGIASLQTKDLSYDERALEYLKALIKGSAVERNFAAATSMYSDDNQAAYRHLLHATLSDDVVTASERKMLSQARLDMGVTRSDHIAAATMLNLEGSIPRLSPLPSVAAAGQSHVGQSSAGIWVPASMAGVLLLAVVGAFRRWSLPEDSSVQVMPLVGRLPANADF